MRVLLQNRSWSRVNAVHEQPDADLADALQNMEHGLLGVVNSVIDVLMQADQFKPTNAPTNIPR
jgi:hypothetical protein